MNIKTALYLLVFTLILLTGCSNSNAQNDENFTVKDENFTVIATEKSFPTNFDELSYKREESPSYEYLVQRVTSEESLANLIQLTDELPTVYLDKSEILLVSYYESSSCPTNIENIDYYETANLNITLKNSGSICTADASPRTKVILLDKELSQNVTHATINEGKTTTKIPIQK